MLMPAPGRSFDFASYEKEQVMPKYVIEREMPGVTELSRDELQGASQTPNEALSSMGGDVRWIQSFVTEDKVFCVYIAPSPERVREHANLAGLPANQIHQVERIIDPTTAEAKPAEVPA